METMTPNEIQGNDCVNDGRDGGENGEKLLQGDRDSRQIGRVACRPSVRKPVGREE